MSFARKRLKQQQTVKNKTVNYDKAFIEELKAKIDKVPEIKYKGKVLNISPSMIKGRETNKCDLAFFRSYIQKEFKVNKSPTSAMNLGKRFEYLFTDAKPKRRGKERYLKKLESLLRELDVESEKVSKVLKGFVEVESEMKTAYSECHLSHYKHSIEDVFATHDIEFTPDIEKLIDNEFEKIKAFAIEYQLVTLPILTKSGLLSAIEKRLQTNAIAAKEIYKQRFKRDVTEAKTDVTLKYKKLKGVLDLLFDGEIQDVKYSGLINDTYKLMSFNVSDKFANNHISKNEYQLAQPIFYTILALLNGIENPTFEYLVFDNRSGRESEHLFIKIQPSNEKLLEFADKIIIFAETVNKMIENGAEATDKSYVCAKCKFKDICNKFNAPPKVEQKLYNEIII